MREAHAHIAAHGREMSYVRLEHARSRDEVLGLLAAAARDPARKHERWILGAGLRPDAWPDPRWPVSRELDDACGDRPCCVSSFDHHAATGSGPALALAGITPDRPDPEHGIIERRDGLPTGVLYESAARLLWNAIPEPTPAQWRGHVARGLVDLRRLGYTEIHDLLSPAWLGPILADMHDRGELPETVWIYPRIEELPEIARGARAWSRSRVRLAGGKLFADGTLNSRTAWMLSEYRGADPARARGTPMIDDDALGGALGTARGLGLGLAVHAIGDAAVRAVLDGAERAGIEPWRPDRGGLPALRIEHAEIIDAADIPRFARLGVVASVQPCHLLTDVEALTRALPHRLDRVLPLRDLIDSGAAVWFGSDVPIVRPEPEDSIFVATQRAAHIPGGPIAPGQAITESEARRRFDRT